MKPESQPTEKAAPAGARALWYVAPGTADLRPLSIGSPKAGEALVRTLWSGISRGTERLVLHGLHQSTHRERMRCPSQEGEFPFPVKYGYCAVGRVEAGFEALLGRTVFALHPHQDRFVAPVAALTLVPEAVPAKRATLAANMETALNALWDANAGPGDRIVIIGAGVVGLLLAALAARLPGADVTVVDVVSERRLVASRLGVSFAEPDTAPTDADVVIHTSGTAKGLAKALRCCGMEAVLVEASWYGDAEVAVRLGEDFHSRRIRLVSSQVGQVSPSRRPRWTPARRLAKALALLADDRLDSLVADEIAFEELPAKLPSILEPGARGLAPVVRYATPARAATPPNQIGNP